MRRECAAPDHLNNARALMDRAFDAPLNLQHISKQSGFSRFYFIRAFRRAFGLTPHQYLTQRRIQRARELLAFSDLSITDICFAVGFQSLGSFSDLFRRHVGHSPSAHRRRALEQKRLLHRSAPACFITMFGIGCLPASTDDATDDVREQFSRSQP
jgi:AraC-like DNA-binding protein